MRLLISAFLIFTLGLAALQLSAQETPKLLPVDADGPGWVESDDVGWTYVSEHTGWILLPRFDDWIYATAETYPWYWNADREEWQNIYRYDRSLYGFNQNYTTVFEEDVLTGNTYQAIEAYSPVLCAADEVPCYMQPSISFTADNRYTFAYTDIITGGFWAFAHERALTDSVQVGTPLLYNSKAGILIVDGYKYWRVEGPLE